MNAIIDYLNEPLDDHFLEFGIIAVVGIVWLIMYLRRIRK